MKLGQWNNNALTNHHNCRTFVALHISTAYVFLVIWYVANIVKFCEMLWKCCCWKKLENIKFFVVFIGTDPCLVLTPVFMGIRGLIKSCQVDFHVWLVTHLLVQHNFIYKKKNQNFLIIYFVILLFYFQF